MSPGVLWRQWRQAPEPAEVLFPSREEAMVMAFSIEAAGCERAVLDVAEAFAKREADNSGWTKR